MPTPPDRVTATCFHTPVGRAGASMRCSAPEPPVVIAKRVVLEPLRGTRNMFAVVPDPKSKRRRQLAVVSSRTNAATVTLLTPLTIPLGSCTWPLAPSRTTEPPSRPGAHDAAPASVAFRPLPEASAARVPLVSSKRYQATNTGGGAPGVIQYTV